MTATAKLSASAAPDLENLQWQDLNKTKFVLLGPVGSLFVRTLTYPATLVKTRMQAAADAKLQPYKGTWDGFRVTYRTEGFRALYKGFAVNAVSVVTGPMYLTVLEWTKHRLHVLAKTYPDIASKYPATVDSSVSLLAGATASVFSQFLIVPIDVVSQRIMMQRGLRPRVRGSAAAVAPAPPASAAGAATAGSAASPVAAAAPVGAAASAAAASSNAPAMVSAATHVATISDKPESAFSVSRSIFKRDGIAGFYRGFWITAVTMVPTSALSWATYTAVKRPIREGVRDAFPALGAWREAVATLPAGFIAGCFSSGVTHPLDTLRTRLQLDERRVGVWPVLKRIYAENGIRGLYLGVTARMLQTGTASCLLFAAYEALKRLSVKSDAS